MAQLIDNLEALPPPVDANTAGVVRWPGGGNTSTYAVEANAFADPGWIYVTTSGNDSGPTAGVRGRSDRPFATLDAAMGVHQSGDTVRIGKGSFAPITVAIPAWVRLVGSGAPHVDSETAPTQLVGGTVIQGSTKPLLDGFEAYDLGFDRGSAVCAALYSGTANDAFIHSTSGTAKRGIRLKNVVGLCKAVGSLFHAIALENVDGAIVEAAKTYHGVHGFVLKGVGCLVDGVQMAGHAWNCCIIKANTLAACSGSIIRNLVMRCLTAGDSGGLHLQAGEGGEGTAVSLNNLIISGVMAYQTTFAIQTVVPASNIINDIQISQVNAVNCPGGIDLSGNLDRVSLTDFEVSNANDPGYGVRTGSEANRVRITNGVIVNCGGDALRLDGAQISYGQIVCQNNGGYSVNAISTTVTELSPIRHLNNGGRDFTGNTIARAYLLAASNLSDLASASTARTNLGLGSMATETASTYAVEGWIDATSLLVNSWANLSTASFFGVSYRKDRDRIQIRGLVNGGSSALIFTLPAGYRPAKGTYVAVGVGGSPATGLVQLGADGTVSAASYSGAWVCLDGISIPLS